MHEIFPARIIPFSSHAHHQTDQYNTNYASTIKGYHEDSGTPRHHTNYAKYFLINMASA